MSIDNRDMLSHVQALRTMSDRARRSRGSALNRADKLRGELESAEREADYYRRKQEALCYALHLIRADWAKQFGSDEDWDSLVSMDSGEEAGK